MRKNATGVIIVTTTFLVMTEIKLIPSATIKVLSTLMPNSSNRRATTFIVVSVSPKRTSFIQLKGSGLAFPTARKKITLSTAHSKAVMTKNSIIIVRMHNNFAIIMSLRLCGDKRLILIVLLLYSLAMTAEIITAIKNALSVERVKNK